MNESTLKHAVTTAGIMAIFALIGTLLLSSTHSVTQKPIADSEREAKLLLFQQVLPAGQYDNDPLQDTLTLPAGELGNREETQAYRARLAGQPVAVILQTTAPDGYGGDIKLLAAVRVDGSIAGVRVLAHQETPGLGDYIDIGHGTWIRNFDNQSLAKTGDDAWKVKKDGGSFDYMAGATITPRAVVKAVHKVLVYFQEHREALFAQASSGGQ